VPRQHPVRASLGTRNVHWKTKAKLFRLFDTVPLGHVAHAFAQQHVTRTLPRPLSEFPRYLQQLDSHIAAFKRHGAAIVGARYMEFGAGWDLFYPLGFCAAGVREEYVFDLTAHARLRWMNHVIVGFRQAGSPHFIRTLPELESIAGLATMGVHYLAPADARATGLADASIDLASSTSVLEHVPPADIASILRELKRICRPGALLSMLIDYEDHYGQRKGDAGIYNFLRFSDREWRKYNTSSHFQNRLRHSDYAALFAASGFETLEVEPLRPDDWREQLARIDLADRFRTYELDDLGISRGRFLLRA
jgi:SAM-dependent methyltransferase